MTQNPETATATEDAAAQDEQPQPTLDAVVVSTISDGDSLSLAGIHEAVVSGSLLRLRPILMTAFTSVIGLIPMIASTGTGAEVSRPLALVVMSGLTTSVLLTLIVLPVLFAMLRERQVTTLK